MNATLIIERMCERAEIFMNSMIYGFKLFESSEIKLHAKNVSSIKINHFERSGVSAH